MDLINTHLNIMTMDIKNTLENECGHEFASVPTGSIFERYGKPLQYPGLTTNLKTDYDVMFAIEMSKIPVDYIMKNDEFLHFFSMSMSCTFSNQLTEFHSASQAYKLSAVKAREFMQNVVVSSHKSGPSIKNLRNVFSFLLNLPRIGQWKQQATETSGPAANYKEKFGCPLNAKDWSTTLDCDFLLSIELPEWPVAAKEWCNRRRFWPIKQAQYIQLVMHTHFFSCRWHMKWLQVDAKLSQKQTHLVMNSVGVCPSVVVN